MGKDSSVLTNLEQKRWNICKHYLDNNHKVSLCILVYIFTNHYLLIFGPETL